LITASPVISPWPSRRWPLDHGSRQMVLAAHLSLQSSVIHHQLENQCSRAVS
jgi:hypothetical protein